MAVLHFYLDQSNKELDLGFINSSSVTVKIKNIAEGRVALHVGKQSSGNLTQGAEYIFVGAESGSKITVKLFENRLSGAGYLEVI